jgi:hypothetical protein
MPKIQRLRKWSRRDTGAYALTGEAPDLSGLSRIINDLILPQASVSHVKSSIVLTTLKDSHRLPLRAAKTAS